MAIISSTGKFRDKIESLWRVADACWYGRDVGTFEQVPDILNGEYILGVNAAGTGTVNIIGVNSSNQVVLPNPVLFSESVAAAAQPTVRLIDSELTDNYAGSVTITGSIAAVRGNTTIASGTTIAGGFVYGTQGKVSIVGTLATANYVAGVIGQLDMSAATAIGTGPLCAIWGDMGATVPGGITTDAGADILKLTNTTALGINSAIYVNAVANFFADITDIGTGGVHMIVGTTASTAAGCLKIKVGGATRYLQIFSSEA